MYAVRVWYHMTALSTQAWDSGAVALRCNPIRLLRKFRNGSAIFQGLAYMIWHMKTRKICNWTSGVFRRKRFVFTPATILFVNYNNEVYLTISGTGLPTTLKFNIIFYEAKGHCLTNIIIIANICFKMFIIKLHSLSIH